MSYDKIHGKVQQAKNLKDTYEDIRDDVEVAFLEEDEGTSRATMLEYLLDLIEFDLSEPEHRLPSLMQSTVEEMETEYKQNITLYPEFESFIDRIRALYS